MNETRNLTLIQLVSEQTMQNVLPILALRPSHVCHVATPRVASRSDWIMNCVRQANVVPELDVSRLTDMPTIPETAQEILRLATDAKKRGSEVIVNFTGGTKMMSIGAYAAAMELHATSVYIDTEHRVFVDGHTGDPLSGFLQNNLAFTPYERALTVNAIAVANGRERVTGGRDPSRYVALSQHLLSHPRDESQLWECFNGQHGITPKGMEPRTADGWRPLVDKHLALSPEVAEFAAIAGLLCRDGDHVRLPDACRNDMRLCQFIHSFFTGAWWEIAIVDAARRSGRFRDVRWGAEAGQRQACGSMEEDVLAVDGVGIAYFSCKRGGAAAKLSRQLEEMDASARRLGGRFVTKFFCVCIEPRGLVAANLKRRATELEVTVLTGNDLLRGNAFAVG